MIVNRFGIQFYAAFGYGWLRLFGVGFGWKDLRQHRLTFSERNGYKRYCKIGHWAFAWLS